MGFNYYRKVADEQEELTNEEAGMIIKYNVIPTLAGGTFVFCAMMFLCMNLPLTMPYLVLSTVAYFALTIATFVVSYRGNNNAAVVLFYGMCIATGWMSYPVLQWANLYLGSYIETVQLFAMAVLGATGVLIFMWIVVRAFPQTFNPSSGFVMKGMWVGMFLVIGLVMWTFVGFFFGFTLYLLVASLAGVLIGGLYTLIDYSLLHLRVRNGLWMFATARLTLDYFILILRIFMLLVLGRGFHK
jgi:FtsH-binding integral membrane protein